MTTSRWQEGLEGLFGPGMIGHGFVRISGTKIYKIEVGSTSYGLEPLPETFTIVVEDHSSGNELYSKSGFESLNDCEAYLIQWLAENHQDEKVESSTSNQTESED